MIKLRPLLKVLCLWAGLLGVCIALGALSSWNETIIGLTVGIVAGFLPSFILAQLGNLREWNVENAEKVYAPLISELQNLIVHFSGLIWLHPDREIDYAEQREGQLSSHQFDDIQEKGLFYRMLLDDKTLATRIHKFYFNLAAYVKKRQDFLQKKVAPILTDLPSQFGLNQSEKELWRRIQVVTKNFLLDALNPDKDENVGNFIGLTLITPILLDYEKLRISAQIPEETFAKFLTRVRNEINGEEYTWLLKNRVSLLKEATEIYKRIDKKLGNTAPM